MPPTDLAVSADRSPPKASSAHLGKVRSYPLPQVFTSCDRRILACRAFDHYIAIGLRKKSNAVSRVEGFMRLWVANTMKVGG